MGDSRFHESIQNMIAQIYLDTEALKKKFCGGGELDPGKPVKHRIKPMSKEFVQRVKKKLDKGKERLFEDDFDSSEEKDPLAPPDFMQPTVKIEELKKVLKRKSNWTRHELLRELGIKWSKEDWRE